MDDHLDPLNSLRVEILRWCHQCGITRVNASVLHVFRHCDGHHYPITGHSVYVYLLEKAITFSATVSRKLEFNFYNYKSFIPTLAS